MKGYRARIGESVYFYANDKRTGMVGECIGFSDLHRFILRDGKEWRVPHSEVRRLPASSTQVEKP